ncbi:MAG: 3-keto-5-aminohexanoate cleavage protein [Deltaproteobacteria bacterium]|nr:3-keto-5-aminohexanoate cleavage protein [Deltaproteobacteria bacterium]MBW2302733.1 3-keto-5-aminohexanoate cleavage protein [Deltaproteobacteria bacterium]
MGKVIFTAALTGNIHTPSMSPYLPLTPEQLIDEAVRCEQAGAAVVHVHARNPEDGKPTTDVEIYREILSGIKARSRVVVSPTTGGTATMTPEERIAVVRELKPEMATFNAGSINFALYPIVGKIKEFKYGWEKEFLESTESFIFSNTFTSLKVFCRTMNEVQTKPELEVYDVGQITNLAQIIREGYLKKPLYLQFVLGILGGIPATIDNLVFLTNTARRVLGDFELSVCAAGRHQFPMGVVNMLQGGHMRVGLEDNLYISKGRLAKSSAEQVEKAIRIAGELGLEPASPDEAREILGLKGPDKVNF